MKKILIICCCLWATNAQSQWNYVSSTPIPGSLIKTLSEDNLLLGNGQLVSKSVDGGLTWVEVENDFLYSFFVDFSFLNDEVGYACGGTYFGMHFSCLMKTIDAGQTWDTISSNRINGNMFFNKMEFVTENIGFLTLDNGGIAKTIDGGESFEVISFFEEDDYHVVHDLNFINEDIGVLTATHTEFISGASIIHDAIYKTTDQGETWEQMYFSEYTITDNSETESILSIEMADDQNIHGVGHNGAYIKSNDGGITWELEFIAPYNSLSLLEFTNATDGYTNIGGIIHKTTNGGDTWLPQTTNPLCFVTDMSALNDEVIFMTGQTTWNSPLLFKTSNAGGPNSIIEFGSEKINIYPNPTTDFFSIEGSTRDYSVSICDLSGRTVKTYSDKTTTYSVEELSSGTYFILLNNGVNSHSFPLIIK